MRAPGYREDYVDVAHIIELAGTGLTHADDREAGIGDIRRREAHASSRHLERGVQGRASEIGEHAGHVRYRRERIVVRQVPGSESRQVATVSHPKCGERGIVGEAFDRADEVGAKFVGVGKHVQGGQK